MSVLGVAEHRNGELRDVTYELIAAGTELAAGRDTTFDLVVIGGDLDDFVPSLNREGVRTIYTVESDTDFNHGIYTQALVQLHDAVDPSVLLMPHTVNGLDYAPAVASRLHLPLVTDVIDWTPTADELTVTRDRYGGKVASTFEIESDQAALTLRPAEWQAADGTAGDAAVESADVDIDESDIGIEVTGFEEVAGGNIDITQADVLVSIGRGIEDEDNIPLIEALADAMGAVVSASRPIVDNGWLPRDRQVGQSGKTVTPDVYIAIGISGAVQHVSGMKGADTIIAINTDPNAPIFDIADYGIVGDLFDVVPELIEEFGGDNPL